MDISGTKRNGKFYHGENLDNAVGRFLTKYDCSNDGLDDWVLVLNLFLRSKSVVVFSTLRSGDNEAK